MTTVPFFGSSYFSLVTGGVSYAGIGEGGSAAGATEEKVSLPSPVSGTVRGLQVRLSGAPGGGNQYSFVLKVNGSGTAVSCVIAGATATTCSNTTSTAAIAAGQPFVLEATPNSNPTARSVTWSFVIEQ